MSTETNLATSQMAPNSCPWGQPKMSPPVASFSLVMDEEYARELQREESGEITAATVNNKQGMYTLNIWYIYFGIYNKKF